MPPASDKDVEEARKQKLDNDKLAAEFEEWSSPSAVAQREATRLKEEAEAKRDAAVARSAAIKTYIPDLSDANKSKLDSTGDAALFGSVLSTEALNVAAAGVAQDLANHHLPDNYRVLVTTDADLISADGTYWDVLNSMDELIAAAESVLNPQAAADHPLSKLSYLIPAGVVAFAKIIPAIGQVVAAALPSLAALLSAQRSISTQVVAADDEAAALAVAAELSKKDREATVIHESFALQSVTPLLTKRSRLHELKLQLVGLNAELTHPTAASGNDDHDLPHQPPPEHGKKKGVENSSETGTALSARAAISAAVVESIDGFDTAVSLVPDGATRSLFTTARRWERLHLDTPKIRYALLIKARSGSTQRLLDDRPLLFKDKFSTVASAGISYLLIETEFSRVIAGGSKTASRALSGSIGAEFHLSPVQTL